MEQVEPNKSLTGADNVEKTDSDVMELGWIYCLFANCPIASLIFIMVYEKYM